MFTPSNGLPGIKAERTARLRKLLLTDQGALYLPFGFTIEGAYSRDGQNTGDVNVLRAGVIMGRVAATGKVRPSILGQTTAAYTSGGTELTVDVGCAVELVRRVGATGTFRTVGAPTATGTVAATTTTYSAVNTSTGVITVTSLGVDKTAGCLILPPVADTSGTPACIIPDGGGIMVTDEASASVDVYLPQPLVGGMVTSSQIVNWPAAANTTLVAWLKAQLRAVCPAFLFSDDFGL